MELKVGDRYRCEALVVHVGLNYGPTLEIDMSTMELIEPAKSPGQKAYEAASVQEDGTSWMPIEWADLGPDAQARWNRVADAARS